MGYKKIIDVQVIQWNAVGDYPNIIAYVGPGGSETCSKCGHVLFDHGLTVTSCRCSVFQGETLVCPGNYVVKDAYDWIDICTTEELAQKYEDV